MREGFIGVHIGAGQHSEARTEIYLRTCTEACRVGTDILRNGGSALEAACAATVVLENASDTNAGYGSNLTESGTVEMDAGAMDGSSLIFGAVGAVPGIKNPILVAKMLVQEQQNGLLPLGRVPPGFLVGEGARDWAVRHGMETVPTESLISEKADKLYRHYKKKLDNFKSSLQSNVKRNHQKSEESCNSSPSTNGEPAPKKFDNHEEDDRVTDTVGVVVLDRQGNVASTVSSGGIALKQPGRVGQAPCYGCGCWAKTSRRAEKSSNAFTVGVSTTGCGEHLVRTLLARECATELSKTDLPFQCLQKVMKEKFVESEFLTGVPEKLGGAICLHYDEKSGSGEFLWTHTTSSMGLAFQATNNSTATTRMSRLPANTSTNPPPNATFISIESASFSTLPCNDSVNESSSMSQSDVLVTQDGKLYRIVSDQQDKRVLQTTTSKA